MQVDELPAIDPNEDLTKILPIQQKRTIAFINHFIMKTVSFLNNFAQSCESRLMEFDYKMQRLEASLLIIESQLSSIPGLENCSSLEVKNSNEPIKNIDINMNNDVKTIEETESPDTDNKEVEVKEIQGVKNKDDPRYKKFFKLLQVGVPEPAVKLKMKIEEVDPNILDHPEDIAE